MLRFLKILLLHLCILCCIKAGGQAGENNVFKKYGNLSAAGKQLKDLEQADTAAIANQVNYTLTIIYRSPDSAFFLLQDALVKSRYLHYKTGIATALCDLAYYNNNLGNYSTSIRYYREGLPYALSAFGHRTSMAMYYSCMSTPYYHSAQYDSMSYYAYKAETLAQNMYIKTANQAIDICGVYNNIGMLWAGIGNYPKSLNYFQKSKALLLAHKPDTLKKNTAALYNATISQVYSNTGLAFFELQKEDSALIMYYQALHYDGENTAALMGISKILQVHHKIPEAIAVLENVLLLAERGHNFSSYIHAKCAYGLLLYKEKQYAKAQKILSEIQRSFHSGPEMDLQNVYETYKALSDIKGRDGNFRQAYLYEKQSLELLDSLVQQQKYQSIYELELKSRTAEKSKQLAQKQLLLTRSENQVHEKNIWISTVGICALLLAVSLGLLYTNSRHKQQLQARRLYTIQQEQEINNLTSAIRGEEKERSRLGRELHDGVMVQLSTAIMNIKTLPEQYRKLSSNEYVHTDYYRQIIQQMEDVAKELRFAAHNLMPGMLLQGGLADAVFYFCNAIQKNTGIEFSCQQYGILPVLPKETELSIYRIVQELVQNIIKHAQATKVIVQLSCPENDILAITVEDNGKGFSTEATGTTTGMGLNNIQSRTKSLGGILDLYSEKGNGTTVHIEFDFNPHAAQATK